MTTTNRQPAGVPTGGQFATSAHAEADVALDGQPPAPTSSGAQPTRQTTGPIRPLDLDISPRRTKALIDMVRDGDLDLAPPYQRDGDQWSTDQQIELIRSFLSKTPIPAIVLNNRATARWLAANGTSPRESGGPAYVAIDGRQRIEALIAWYRGDLAVPASWFPADDLVATRPTDDGPYVTWDDLGRRTHMDFNQDATIPVAEASLATVEDEAAMYLRVNGAGTAQTDADMARAAAIANGATQ